MRRISGLLTNTIKIPIWNKDKDGCFTINSFHDYIITYAKGVKKNELRIIVNGKLSKHKINLLNPREGWKKVILTAISEEKNGLIGDQIVKKMITHKFINQHYSAGIIHMINYYLLAIKKETTRDVLTKYNLFDIYG